MKTLQANWKTILIVILAIAIGVILTRSCRKSVPDTTTQGMTEALKIENEALIKRYAGLSDSIGKVIQLKDKVEASLSKQLNQITVKYRMLINREPSHDTVIKTNEVFIGNECLEKLPIIQAELRNCESVNSDFKNLVEVKNNQITDLQAQFEQSGNISAMKDQEIKKAKRKAKWLRVGLISETVVVFGGLIYLLAGK